MKKAFIALTISSSIMMASYTQEDRIKDMQIMAEAMQDIQNGFFFNNFDMIKAGGVILSDTIMRIEPPLEEKEEKDVMTRFMNNKVKMTNTTKKKIKKKTHKMIERFRDGDYTQALQNFTKITKECMKCHTQLRKW
ncbi:MAG TPA: cytochrome C [Campylobacterales bacterium]|nr:cytochrome C [Campylobacterales bacterium]